jgi:nucleolar protein 56
VLGESSLFVQLYVGLLCIRSKNLESAFLLNVSILLLYNGTPTNLSGIQVIIHLQGWFNMPVYLAITAFGAFILNENCEIVGQELTFPDVELSVSNLSRAYNGELTDVLKAIESALEKQDTDTVIVENSELATALSMVKGIQVNSNSIHRQFRDTQITLLIENKIVDTKDKAKSFRRNVALKLAKLTVSAASEEKDLLIKHAADAIEELDKSINILTMRVREWYSLHHPLLSRLIEDQEKFVSIVKECPGKDQLNREKLGSMNLSENLIDSIMDSVAQDIGADFTDSDFAIIQTFTNTIESLYALRERLEEYVTELMKTVAPNITNLVGPLVGARLVSSAGSLKELARKPSSTIQVFGAEKALFRSLKTGADPPKHGIIFQVPEIHSAPYWQRGKIARALAGKLSIAAKIDAYSKRDAGKNLRLDFEKRLEEIKRQNPEAPPPKPPRKPSKLPKKKRAGRTGKKRKRR